MKVKVRHLDDDTLYRATEVQLRGGTLTTPVKALDLSKVTAGIPLGDDIGGVNEIWRTVKVDAIPRLMTDTEADRGFLSKVRTAFNKGQARGDVNVLFLALDSPRIDHNALEYLADTAYSYSDMVAVPLIQDIHKNVREGLRDPLFRAYVDTVQTFIEVVEQRNSKPLVGTIPPFPWLLNKEVSDLYVNLGVRAFCVDFGGRTPTAYEARNLRPFLRRLKEEELEDECILYAINANTGRAVAGFPPGVAPAKDVLSYGFGFDVLGQKHIGLKGPQEMFNRLQSQGPTARLFNKDTYAYQRVPLDDVDRIFPADTLVPRDAIKNLGRSPTIQAIVNMEQHGFEALRLRRVIRDAEVLGYLDTKSALQNRDKKQIREARAEVQGQKELEEWY